MKKNYNNENNNKENNLNELNDIKMYYYELEQREYYPIMFYNDQNFFIMEYFNKRMKDMINEDKLMELENKIKQYSGNENIQIKKNQLDDIIKKYNKVKEQSVNDFKFCNVLLTKLMVEFTKRTNKTFSQETYDKVCKDIIHSQIEKFIKYNKEVINIKELLNEIKF